MTVSTMDQLAAALAGGYRLSTFKQAVVVSGNGWNSYWTAAGQPGAGSTPPSGVGEAPTNATPGALAFVNPGGGASSYLSGLEGTTAAGSTTPFLYDRLVHTSGLSGTVATAQTVNSAAITRPDANGANTELFLEVYGQVGGSGTGATISYTNQSGVSGRSGTCNMGGAGINAVGQVIPVALAAGDTGVRSVQSVTLGGSTGTAGNFGVTIARKLALLPAAAAGLVAVRDPFGIGLARIYDSACLFWVGYGSGSAFQALAVVAQG